MNYSDVIPGLIGLIPRINIGNIMLADTVMYTIGRRLSRSHIFFKQSRSTSLSVILAPFSQDPWLSGWPTTR